MQRIFAIGLWMILLASPSWADPGEDLRQAAMAGNLGEVKRLLDAGAPVDAAARHGQTALFFAAGQGHLPIVTLLLERGAKLETRDGFFGVELIDTALRSGNQEVVALLLARGVEGAGNVLYVAAENDDLGLARLAIATGKIEPLDLAAARKVAEGKSAEIRELLAQTQAQKRERPPFVPSAERLVQSAGDYFPGENAAAALIAPPESKVSVTLDQRVLSLQMPGSTQKIALQPISADYFESADGQMSAAFLGRGGTIEWLFLNRAGELQNLARVSGADSNKPLPAVEASATPDPTAAAPAALAPRGPAQPWPQFRGPHGGGQGDGQGLPLSWDVAQGRGVVFKTPIPGIGLASPVIWGDRIYLTTAISSKGDATFRIGNYGDPSSVDDRSEHSFRVYALDAKSGAIVWDREVFKGPPGALRHLKSSLANSSPVTDGDKVVVLFGAVGILATFDRDGQKLWQRDLGVFASNDPMVGQSEWGHAASPILIGDLIIVQADRKSDSFLAAYRLKDGEEVWRVPRVEPSTWSTPTWVPGPKGGELVVNGPIVRGYDPQTGQELWHLGPNSEVVVATPVFSDDLIYITAGYPPIRPVYAIRRGQKGDLSLPSGSRSNSSVVWSHDRGGTYVPSPIYYRGHLHTLGSFGILTTYHGTTGESLSTVRLSTSGVSISASPIAADGHLLIFTEEGEGFVLAAGPEPKLIGRYPMGEIVMATPALSDGLLVVRTLGHVVGLRQEPGKNPG